MKNEIKARQIQKHDTSKNWTTASNAEKPFIPLKGEIIIYDIDENYNYERFKIGDGVTNVGALPFADKTSIGSKTFSAGANNVSGTKSFTITWTTSDGDGYLMLGLDSVDGLAEGQECRFKTNSEYYTTIKQVGTDYVILDIQYNSLSMADQSIYSPNTEKGEYADSTNSAIVRSADGTDTEKNSLFIIGHPEIGTDRILGTNAASFGSYNNASSLNTFVAGSENNALGGFSAVFGKTNSAAYGGIVGGRNNDARLSEYGATFGYGNIYTGQSNYAFAAGGQNELNGAYTVALGGKNKINGVGSSALGIANEINGNYSNAFGYYNKTNSNYQVVVGTYNEPIVDALFMVGNGTKGARSNAFVVQKDGDVLIPRTATIYGELNLAGPMTASDMINANKGIVSTVYSGVDNTIVLNTGANKATGKFSIVGGANTNAKGYYSTALGYYTVADKVATFVAGANNASNANYQTIFGSYANNTTDSLFTVGNGSSSAKSNAFDVTKDGRAYLGNADIDETNETSIATKKYVDSKFVTDQGVTVKLENEFNSVDLGPIGMFLASNYHINIDSNEVNINTKLYSGSTTIKNVVEPIEDGDAVNKKYVDNKRWGDINNRVNFKVYGYSGILDLGDNNTGDAKLSSGRTLNLYGLLQTNIGVGSVGDTIIKNVVTPTNDTDAANKKYVDEKITSTTITWGTF